MGYKCVSCGSLKQSGERYYRVRIVQSDGGILFVPTCSEYCAKEVQKKYIKLHQSRVDYVKNQCFQVIKWED